MFKVLKGSHEDFPHFGCSNPPGLSYEISGTFFRGA